MTMMMMMN